MRDAQKGLPTGSVYTTNEENLATLGAVRATLALRRLAWLTLVLAERKPTPTRAKLIGSDAAADDGGHGGGDGD